MEQPSYLHTAIFLKDGKVGQFAAPSDSIHTIQWLSATPQPIPEDSPVLVALRFIAYVSQGDEKLARPLKLSDIHVETLPLLLMDCILSVSTQEVRENGKQCCWVTMMDSHLQNHVFRM